jgi:hypothetical protein
MRKCIINNGDLFVIERNERNEVQKDLRTTIISMIDNSVESESCGQMKSNDQKLKRIVMN